MNKEKYILLYKENFNKYCKCLHNKSDIKITAEIDGKISILKEILKDFSITDKELAEIEHSAIIEQLTTAKI